LNVAACERVTVKNESEAAPAAAMNWRRSKEGTDECIKPQRFPRRTFCRFAPADHSPDLVSAP
jgi:hypothetical protein